MPIRNDAIHTDEMGFAPPQWTMAMWPSWPSRCECHLVGPNPVPAGPVAQGLCTTAQSLKLVANSPKANMPRSEDGSRP